MPPLELGLELTAPLRRPAFGVQRRITNHLLGKIKRR